MYVGGLAQAERKQKKWARYRRYGYVMVTIIVAALTAQWFLREFVLFPIQVNSEVMAPTIQKGERVFILQPHLAQLKIRSVVLVRIPGGNYHTLCRVAALEGDRIQLQKTVLTRNKKQQSWPIHFSDETILAKNQSVRDQFDATAVPPGHFFCMHDNGTILQDSRTWGALPIERIVGLAYARGVFWGAGHFNASERRSP